MSIWLLVTTPQVTILQLRRGAASGRLHGTVTKQRNFLTLQSSSSSSSYGPLKSRCRKKMKQAEKLPTNIQEEAGSHLSGTPAIRTGFHGLPYYLQVNAETIIRIRPQPLASKSSPNLHSIHIPPLDATGFREPTNVVII